MAAKSPGRDNPVAVTLWMVGAAAVILVLAYVVGLI